MALQPHNATSRGIPTLPVSTMLYPRGTLPLLKGRLMRLTAFIIIALAACLITSISTSDALAGGCPSQQQVLPSNSSDAMDGFMCAQDNVTGKLSINAWATHSWTVGTNIAYFPHYMCHDESSSGFTMSELAFYGSGTITATNWNTGTRHWAGLILWTPDDYEVNYQSGCSVSDQVWNTPPDYLGITTIALNSIAIGGQSYWTAGQPTTNYVASCGVPVAFNISLNHASSVAGNKVLLINGYDSSNKPIILTAATIGSDGTATLTWYPNSTPTDLQIVYPGWPTYNGETPGQLDLPAFTVAPNADTRCVAITNVTATEGTTAVATVSVAPSNTDTIVALLSDTPSGTTKLGQGVARAGSSTASISFPFTANTLYTFVAAAVDSSGNELGQSDPYPNPGSNQWQSGALPATSTTSSVFAFSPAKPWSSPDPALMAAKVRKLVSRTQTVRADLASMRLECPKGSQLLHADAMTNGPLDDFVYDRLDRTGVTITPLAEHIGYRLMGQILCRVNNARPETLGTNNWFGNQRANTTKIQVAKALIYAGGGADVIKTTGVGSTVYGGLGNDLLRVAGNRSVASGGMGNDRVIAQGTASALITGGPGNDRLTGSLGTTRINAIDGTGGDTVVCRSMQTYVAADVGDKLIGTCTVVTLRTPIVGNVTG